MLESQSSEVQGLFAKQAASASAASIDVLAPPALASAVPISETQKQLNDSTSNTGSQGELSENKCIVISIYCRQSMSETDVRPSLQIKYSI